ncbi:MAG: Rpn family recombination-promoting nuclease/putative transposase [Lentisphaeria bacterium]|nr:Rpn family recombination-promoting nuclease/putative transposase [Lentisphaeria bacterium]
MTKPFIQERYINPITDFGFKRLFGTESNKDLLIDFLNAIIGLKKKECIRDVTFLNPEQLGTTKNKRKAVFDIYCKTEQGDHVIVEMQSQPVQFFKDRSLFYSAFPIRDQAIKGDTWNFELKGIYAIGLLNFCFSDGKDDERYLHRVKLMDIKARKVFYDKLTFVFAELPKFKKQEEELKTQLDKWLYAIKHLYKLDEPPPVLSGKMFDKLFHEAAVASLTTMEQNAYAESQKQYLYYVNSLKLAKQQGEHVGKHIGLKIGFQQGHEKGFEEGHEKGFEEGRNSEREKIIQAMKEQGLSDEAIATILQTAQNKE